MSVNKFIFILGTSRCGSKFYSQLLNSSKAVSIAPEMIFKHPFKSDLFQLFRRLKIKNLTAKELVEKILRANLKSTLNQTIDALDIDALEDQLKAKKVMTEYDLFSAILVSYGKRYNKSIYGAKYPVHPKYIFQLDSLIQGEKKFLFLTRDPRDIYLSDYLLKKKGINNNTSTFPVRGILMKPAVLLYSIREWKNSLKYYERFIKTSRRNRIMLIKYEDLVKNRDDVVNKIKLFTSIHDFNLEKVKVVDSSFNGFIELYKWKKKLNILERLIFYFLASRTLKKYNYKLF
ncbi:MAG: sulfotransferase [Cytophagia bacterium]|nr:sulfotransferase [Cytophagia bacterium]